MDATLTRNVRPPASSRQTNFYAHLKEQLLEALVRGGQPGDRLPSERQLAREFESSPMTIGRILQEFQSEGLLYRVPGKGTFICEPAAGQIMVPEPATPVLEAHPGIPSVAAFTGGVTQSREGALPRHTCILANLSAEPDNRAREYWTNRTVSVVERYLQKAGIRTSIVNRGVEGKETAEQAIARVREDGADSAVFVDSGTMSRNKQNATSLAWLQAVAAWRYSTSSLSVVRVVFGEGDLMPFDTVSMNGAHGAFIAANHLLELGHREIAVLTRALPHGWVQDRARATVSALQLHGIDESYDPLDGVLPGGRFFCCPEPPEDLAGMDDWTWTAQALAEQFFENEAEARRYTAVIAINDQVATQFIAEAEKRGYRIPEDFSLVGFDDLVQSKALGLTTIHPPIEEMAEKAAAILLQRHREPLAAMQTSLILHPTLVQRSSTRKLI